MDEIVRQALIKWPHVPYCYGWLALDARGHWRMRDEQAQQLGLPGDRISHAPLTAFINRNYLSDDRGRWYFQNGPQRVYVTLEATPFIARTDPQCGFLLHTGRPLPQPEAVWLTESGNLVLQQGDVVAQLDDRDLADCLPRLFSPGSATPVTEQALLDWMQVDDDGNLLELEHQGKHLPVRKAHQDALPTLFGFVPTPTVEDGEPD